MLDNKMGKLISMMSKLSTHSSSNQMDHLSPRHIKEERKDKVEIIIMIEVGNRIALQ